MLLPAPDGQIEDTHIVLLYTHNVKGLIGVLVKQILGCLQRGGKCMRVCVRERAKERLILNVCLNANFLKDYFEVRTPFYGSS